MLTAVAGAVFFTAGFLTETAVVFSVAAGLAVAGFFAVVFFAEEAVVVFVVLVVVFFVALILISSVTLI